MITESMITDYGAPKLPRGYMYRVEFPSPTFVEVYIEKRRWFVTTAVANAGNVLIYKPSNLSYDEFLMKAVVKVARTAYSDLEEELSEEVKRQKRSEYSGTVR